MINYYKRISKRMMLMMIIIVTVIQIHIKYAFVGFPLYMVHTEASTINFRIACYCLVIPRLLKSEVDC